MEKEEGGGVERGRDTKEGESDGRGGATARGLSYDQPSPLTLVLLLLRLRTLRTLEARIDGGGDAGGEGHCSGSVISKYDSFLLWVGGEYEYVGVGIRKVQSTASWASSATVLASLSFGEP